MVKLFLVCFAVCMGATSGTVSLGHCPEGGATTDFSKFNGRFKCCGMSSTSYNELIKLLGVAEIKTIYLDFKLNVKKSDTSTTANLKIYGENKTTPLRERQVNFRNEGGVTKFKGLEGIASSDDGNLINKPCGSNVLTTMCSDLGTGMPFISEWTEINGKCADQCDGRPDGWHSFNV